jgi:hypothetical protein
MLGREGESVMINCSKFLPVAALLLASQFCFGQQTALHAILTDSEAPASSVSAPVSLPEAPLSLNFLVALANEPSTPTATPAPAVVRNDAPPAADQDVLERWLDVKNASFSVRYRNVTDTDGAHEFNQGSQRTIYDGKFKFDAAGKYGLAFHVSSGHYFSWAYADFMGGGLDEATGKIADKLQPDDLSLINTIVAEFPFMTAGAESGGWGLYFRRLYFDANPVKQVEFQAGSLDIDRGAGSEITTYDDDGYMAGERIALRDPKHLFFDQVSFSYAYMGDLFQPNFFARAGRMTQGNYRQYMVRKTLFKRIDGSADFTDVQNINTLREAAFVKIPEIKVVDSVRVEAYQRINAPTIYFFQFPRANGYAITGSKTIKKRVELVGGFANIDWAIDVYDYNKVLAIRGFALNGDGYNNGRRYFMKPTIHITKNLTAGGFYSHMLNYNYDADGYLWNKVNLQAGFAYDFTDMFHRGNKTK